MEEIVNAEQGAPCSQQHARKKELYYGVKKGVISHSASKQLTESAAIACVKLCKISTYIPTTDNALSTPKVWLQSVINDVKALLFNPAKPFARGQNDIDLMIDCMVACFRITPHNAEAQKVFILYFDQLK